MDVTQQYTQAYLAEDRGWELIQVAITFAVLETLFLCLFFASRALNKTLNGLDVYFIPPAYIFCFSHVIMAPLGVKYAGIGHHAVALNPRTVVMFLKVSLIEEFFYVLSIVFSKLAILCLYERLFTTKFYRRAIAVTAVVIVLTCVASLVLAFAICQPFAYNWNKTIPGGQCANLMASYRYISIPNLVTDVIMLILPLHVVWHLHTGVAQKIGLTVTFMTGCIGIVTSAFRLVSFFQTSLFADPTYLSVKTLTWTMVEPGVYLIAATLPSLRPLLRHIVKDLEVSTLFTRLRSYYTRAFSTQRKAGDTSPTGMHSGSGKPNFTTNTVGSGSKRSTGFRKLDEHMEQLNLPSLEDERELKTLHTHRERYEGEGDGNRLWLPDSFGVTSGSRE